MDFFEASYKDFDKVVDIYKEAFPYEERKPVCMQKHMMKKGKYHVHFLMEEDTILGFMTSVKLDNLVMLDYLAVNQKIRSKGVGSEILKRVVEFYKDCQPFLMCESLDDKANNNEQRKRRKQFYYRNGFKETGITVNGISGRMDLMVPYGNITPDDYIKMQTYAIGKFLMKFGNIHVE